ncbi:ribokinase [Agromyces sp. LHK192]|uniref:ribokinase n=1 Tax=Agromyces sp. LHK192 TaxID=2498704 RepID=UPI000FDA4B5C|nr:ribokinase [Agromyces sp. LHK192]
MSSRVVVFGSLNVDATCYVDAFARPGETISASGFRLALGGKGTNQAVAAHVAGAEVDLLARIGDDANGALATETLERLGLSTRHLERIPDAPTGVALITVTASGENTVVVAGGANLDWTAADVELRGDRLAGADIVLTQGELPAEVVDRVAAAAAEAGIRFVLNLAPPVPVAASTLALADPLVVNEHEARQVGIGPHLDGTDADADDLVDGAELDVWREATAAAVRSGLARSLVVTLGAAGAVAATETETVAVTAPTVQAVDTTGAGDGFTGTLAAFLAEGRGLDDAVRIAVAAASLAVQHPGTVDAYASRERVLEASDAVTGRKGGA